MSTPNTSTKNFIRGGQIILHNLRMLNQIATRVFLLGLIGLLLFLFTWFFLRTNSYERYIFLQWMWAHIYLFFSGKTATQHITQPDGVKSLVYSSQMLNSSLMQMYLSRISSILLSGLLVGLLFTFTVIAGITIYLKKRGKTHTENKRIKGDYLITADKLKKELEISNKASDLQFGSNKLPIVKHAEKQHILFDGTTGTGKSNAIKELLDYIRTSGDRAIVWDEGGHYLSEFYNEDQDKILNALDERGFSWHLWDECKDVADFENLAAALIPMIGVQDPFWVLGARTIFSEVAYSMCQDENRNVQKLLRLLLTASLDNIKTHLENTFASTLVSDKIEKTAISIKSVMAAYLKCLRYVKDEQDPFSIRQWIQNDNTSEWLFISSLEKKHEALKPLITAWLDIAINELLSLPENPNRRVWIILDELTSLHKIPTLFKVLSKSRKAGGCVVIGIQNYAQLADVYGSNGAKIISSLLNTRFIFRQPDPDMAAWSARNLGETTIDEVREGISYGANTMRDGISINRMETRKPLVSPSEIMTMDNLKCFLRLPGSFPITQLCFNYAERKGLNSPFIERDLGQQNEDLDELLNKYDKPGLRADAAESGEINTSHLKTESNENNKKLSAKEKAKTKVTTDGFSIDQI